MGPKAAFTYLGYALGALMIFAGVGSVFVGVDPHPELATAGVTLVLASGLVGSKNGNGKNGNGKGR